MQNSSPNFAQELGEGNVPSTFCSHVDSDFFISSSPFPEAFSEHGRLMQMETLGRFSLRNSHVRVVRLQVDCMSVHLKGQVITSSKAVVPNGVGTAHRWALKRSKGAFVVQGKFRGRWGPTAAPLGNTRKNVLKSLINTKNLRTHVSTNSSKCLLSRISPY
jgi:hypothetical protein